MTVQTIIEDKISKAFDLEYSLVENESHMHNVPAGSESHFKLVLVTQAFDELSLVARHKLLYKLLADELESGVHALALHTYTTAEWQKKQTTAPESPLCHGGNK